MTLPKMPVTLDQVARWLRKTERDIQRRLTWSRLYRATSYVRSALWVVPFVAIVLVLVAAPMVAAFDDATRWRLAGLGAKGAESLFQTVVTLSLSFLVFTFGSLLVAIQIASGQLTPRIIATTLLRDNVVRYTVGLFVFTLIFSVMALDRLEDHVHQLVTIIVAVLGVVSMAAFLFLIDYAARLLRPVAIVARVSADGFGVIDSVYPDEAEEGIEEEPPPPELPDAPRRVVRHTGRSEIALAVDLNALMFQARRTRGFIEFVPHVGDFVANGVPLFVLYGGATAIEDGKLRAAVAFGPERTMEQDPLFAFRILVDIALKALSPAINDPTTAVVAIDQIHRLLRMAGARRLRGDVIADNLGRPRLIYRTPNWEDFVHLSFTEIRACGAGHVQVARRLRAMLEDLTSTLPRHRHRALKEERARLDEALKSHYPIPADLALASVADSQGLGGGSSPGAAEEAARGEP
jgi:uncharacterized membrane protein